MWITSDVNLPQAILDAQAEGRLVLFVGAGASVDAPSDLPLFDKLARQLAEMARVPFDEDVTIDFFLGSMPESFDTHRHTYEIVSREDSAPNTTHAALVGVASSIGPLRIVTTNFDTHLSSAATAGGIKVPDTWIGPALPLGEDFTGIVHLHGSVLRSPEELVLTDRDFGRAYLTSAWATRFLLPMFQRFTVLFIGYSHDDPIMRYLALGLPSGTPRYAFTSTDEVNHSKWSRLKVQPIGYPVQGHDHTALVAALEAWSLRARMGQTEHRARILEVVAGGPQLTPVDYDYLVDQLKNPNGAREFVHAVTVVKPRLQVAWLHWAEALPKFKSIFNGHDGDSAATVLGNWFCQSFIASPELHGAALQTLQRLGQAFGNGLFQAAGWAADELSKADSGAGRRWKAFLATSVHGHSGPVATATLLSYVPGDQAEDLTVIRAALRPYLALKRRWSLDDSEDLTTLPQAEVHWLSEAESLTGHVLKVVETAPPGDPKLGTVLEDSLSAAYDLLDAYHGPRSWDPLSYGRSAVEPHEQDQFRDPVDAVLDGLRAYGEKALVSCADLPEKWWFLGRALFRRLALHLLARDASRSYDEKISWLLERSVLFETDVKHETYGVLKASAEKASKEVRAQLLSAALAGPNQSEDIPDLQRHTAYATYNLLVWLTQVAPGWAEAGSALEAVRAKNPDFAPRENPDFDSWMTSGTWGEKLPMELEDFIRSFEEDSTAAVADLLARDYSERNFDEPDWRGALSLLSGLAESRPELGQQLWTLIDELPGFESLTIDIRLAIVEGWTKAYLRGNADAVVERVATLVPNPKSVRSVSRFLLEQVRKDIESDETPALAGLRRIAFRLWREHCQSFTHAEELDLNSFAPLYLNSWPGDLAQYWITEVDRRWRKHRDDWSGLNDDERSALTELLDGPPHALDATRPAMASHLFFLFAADATFTAKQVLPLFREDTTAALAWIPYLFHPRYNDKLLEAGLLDSTIAEWDRLEALGSHLQSQFFALVASIVSFAGIPPASRRALLDQSVLADDGAHAADFAHAIVRFLGADGVDGTKVWKQWLRDHLSARLNGLPRTPDSEELTCWADIVPYLGDAIPEATELLGNHGIGLGDRFFVPKFPQDALSAHGRVLVSHFAERVRNSLPGDYSRIHHVNELIEVLRGALGDTGVQALVHAATAGGFLGGSPNE
ncbi:SIR2 family protein [Pseudarthrobacter sp. LT1]|uniref:SIR2 family protein n=1 Tax=Pseudarthrobacter sp. LT1 TaxID=3111450 RepID=UPI002D78F794|nr:SIR2 family protein [Pseudarthrobacter sp. LT1]WRT12465.1 SIR2 family protein [Pseudarthrobacter sp. LT1]